MLARVTNPPPYFPVLGSPHVSHPHVRLQVLVSANANLDLQ